MTEEAAATPGWVSFRLDEVFQALPASPAVSAARDAYAECLASRKAPASPSDMLGAEFEGCDSALRRQLQGAGVSAEDCDRVMTALEAVEAEIASES